MTDPQGDYPTPPQDTWATVADVNTYTGMTVTTDILNQSGAHIDIASSRTYALDWSRVGMRDSYFLQLAVCYQAAWLTQQFDAYSRMDIQDVTQGRSRLIFNPLALTLAPFARRALKRVSWLKSRSVHTRTSFTDGIGASGMDPLASSSDDLGPWNQIQGW